MAYKLLSQSSQLNSGVGSNKSREVGDFFEKEISKGGCLLGT